MPLSIENKSARSISLIGLVDYSMVENETNKAIERTEMEMLFMPKYFGMDVIYREPKSNSAAADLPRYRYAGLGSTPNDPECKLCCLVIRPPQYVSGNEAQRSSFQ